MGRHGFMTSKVISLGSPKLLSQALWIAGAFSFAAITALSSKLIIPLGFTPVPISLQSLSVVMAGLVLGSKAGALSQIILIGLGLVGLPVFSSPLPGNLVLAGPTGGYIFGFVLTAFFSGWIRENFLKRNPIQDFALIFLGSLFIFIPGVLWLSQFTGQNLWLSIQLGFFPFIVGDLIKCALATALLSLLTRR